MVSRMNYKASHLKIWMDFDGGRQKLSVKQVHLTYRELDLRFVVPTNTFTFTAIDPDCTKLKMMAKG